MTIISSLSNWPVPLRQAAPVGNPAAAPASSGTGGNPAPAPSSIVSLSARGLAAARQDDSASRFQDMGAAMLARFGAGAAIPVDSQPLPADLDNKFTLDVVTASGVRVGLTLANAGDDMVLQASASAALNDDERQALAGLAGGFQAAIDGMAGGEPKVRLGALAGFEAGALQSVDFHADVTLSGPAPGKQSLDFHVDGASRKVGIAGPAGAVDVAVDTGRLESLGGKRQQAQAIDAYLKQFDEAGARGHADGGLLTMFKDAFSDLSRTATRDEPAPSKTWSRRDRAVVSGLPDFSASVSQATQRNNLLRQDETDGFRYEVAQRTQTGGARADRSLAQARTAHLTAQYHEARDGRRKFGATPAEQNYDYHQVDDASSSTTSLEYKDGKLHKATLAQSTSQSERVQTYLLGKMTAERNVPWARQVVKDLLPEMEQEE